MKTDERGDLVIIESHGLLPMNRTKFILYKSRGELPQTYLGRQKPSFFSPSINFLTVSSQLFDS